MEKILKELDNIDFELAFEEMEFKEKELYEKMDLVSSGLEELERVMLLEELKETDLKDHPALEGLYELSKERLGIPSNEGISVLAAIVAAIVVVIGFIIYLVRGFMSAMLKVFGASKKNDSEIKNLSEEVKKVGDDVVRNKARGYTERYKKRKEKNGKAVEGWREAWLGLLGSSFSGDDLYKSNLLKFIAFANILNLNKNFSVDSDAALTIMKVLENVSLDKNYKINPEKMTSAISKTYAFPKAVDVLSEKIKMKDDKLKLYIDFLNKPKFQNGFITPADNAGVYYLGVDKVNDKILFRINNSYIYKTKLKEIEFLVIGANTPLVFSTSSVFENINYNPSEIVSIVEDIYKILIDNSKSVENNLNKFKKELEKELEKNKKIFESIKGKSEFEVLQKLQSMGLRNGRESLNVIRTSFNNLKELINGVGSTTKLVIMSIKEIDNIKKFTKDMVNAADMNSDEPLVI